jgi:predicted DCC family thiol-disulfide oxidoreductase YuxK
MKNSRKEIIIYDSSCNFCKRAAEFFRKLGIITFPIQESYEILSDIFGGEKFPFALYLLDDDGLFWGEEAVFKLMKNRNFGPLSYSAYVIYPILRKLNKNTEKINEEKGICGCMLSGSRKIDKEKIEKIFEKVESLLKQKSN